MTEILKQSLQAAALKKNGSGVKQSESEEDKLFSQEYLAMRGQARGGSTYRVIPQFYKSPPADEDLLQQKLREEARAQFLQRRSKMLLDNAELKELWVVLDSHTSGPPLGEEQMMDWDQFCVVRKIVSEKCREYFKVGIRSRTNVSRKTNRSFDFFHLHPEPYIFYFVFPSV